MPLQLADIIDPERVVCGVEMASKKRALEKLSDIIAKGLTDTSAPEVFECLLARERLGSTGLGKGIAIPHARLKKGRMAVAAFMKLKKGVDYDAPDRQPVDLLCALLVPPESNAEHLEVLATLSEMFSQPEVREKLRAATSNQELYQIITQWTATAGA